MSESNGINTRSIGPLIVADLKAECG